MKMKITNSLKASNIRSEFSKQIQATAKLLLQDFLAVGGIASFIRNHHVAEDLPRAVGLLLPSCQIFLDQLLATAERCLGLAPFIDKASLFRRSPRLDGGGARPSKARKLSCHLSLNLDPSAKTFAGGPTIDSVFAIGRNNSFDVLGLDPVDPGLISGIDQSPRGD